MAKISKGWAFVGAGSQAAAGNNKDIQFNNNENLSGSHLLRTDGTGSLSASAGITGSAFKTPWHGAPQAPSTVMDAIS